MRKLTLTARQFDVFVYPQIATSRAETEAEFDTAVRLIRKLRDVVLTAEVPPSEAEIAEAQKTGASIQLFRRLVEANATFLLEEDEWELLQKRVKAHRMIVSMGLAEEFAELLNVIADAPEYKVEVAT